MDSTGDSFPQDSKGRLILPPNVLERFWVKVDRCGPDDCWAWLGAAVNDKGHGCFRLQGRTQLAHRISFLIHSGPIPDGLWVLHTCDNAPCVNPRHLKLGTRADNIREMWAKGRGNWGKADGTTGKPRLHSGTRPRSRVPHVPPMERLMARVVKPDGEDGCWLWTGSVNKKGYGRWDVPACDRQTHRASYELFIGPIPDGLWVLHDCDTPSCVNPDHLWLGTNADNVADKMAKGRNVHPKDDPELYARWYAAMMSNRASGQRHGRYTKPERNVRGAATWCAVLDDEKVRQIRAMAASGMRGTDIARHFGVRKNVVSRVLTGETWKHVV